jgi:hypothetical protein
MSPEKNCELRKNDQAKAQAIGGKRLRELLLEKFTKSVSIIRTTKYQKG